MNSFGVVVTSTVEVGLRSDQEIVKLRQIVRDEAIAQGFSLVDQTKFVTAASELARNTLLYGGGGDAKLSVLLNGTRKGLKLTFVDQGAGIPDIERALQDGFTSGSGLGLGLGGARRLCDEFEIQSEPGKGTTVSITKWKLR
ncbi:MULTISPECIES: anti-sigma regulatory factor [Paraburkholderia]|jgi:serine/threonine-protein kinase RsbT|uniref:Anti-sigma regulatory factor n=1 Tax=Paraburkholderia largidicola TaxID=3014751 RepID=A0A7I8BFD1_9BURK|nr:MULTISPECIES: anti-sigma regulatory factor [Paraburkholderia]BCF87109.1 anti-sigma regulatory factor [Paraburkholderia sp. PGU16]GJG99187.1 ATP-binding protein [Paraburkholderia terrae]GJH34222.1 ATP-binding protein [Paraburkholderia hospita]CAG9262063.1 Serine/threonine-protein kinase RsbT [Paraburkholderia caribensis]